MRKKLVFLVLALATAAGAALSAPRAEALSIPTHCVTTCCDDGRCLTCCPHQYCLDIAC
ncbi:MAG TPA: hypothetical protein VF173_07365 [Thermoanaerobaculia bacterium]|nr:hypothetical protein [Thermoanaerobaculia bacterium]